MLLKFRKYRSFLLIIIILKNLIHMPIPSVTLFLVIITVIVSFSAWNKPELLDKCMMNPYRVHHNKEYFRFISSGFIHADYVHLFFNMYSFYMFGELCEAELGPLNFTLLYLLGIIVSIIPTYFKYRNVSYYNSLGASGGVSAVIFSCIFIFPVGNLRMMFLPIDIKCFIFGGLYLFYCYYMAKRGRDNINHDAHFYGALFGVVYTAILIPGSLSLFIEQVSNWRMF
jgi:membrane associated rhomboid family serine protease